MSNQILTLLIKMMMHMMMIVMMNLDLSLMMLLVKTNVVCDLRRKMFCLFTFPFCLLV